MPKLFVALAEKKEEQTLPMHRCHNRALTNSVISKPPVCMQVFLLMLQFMRYAEELPAALFTFHCSFIHTARPGANFGSGVLNSHASCQENEVLIPRS